MYQDSPGKMARRWQEKGQTGKFPEVSITETVRQASRRVGSPEGEEQRTPNTSEVPRAGERMDGRGKVARRTQSKARKGCQGS